MVRIDNHTIALDTILEYYARAIAAQAGTEFVAVDTVVDTAKNRVVLSITADAPDKQEELALE